MDNSDSACYNNINKIMYFKVFFEYFFITYLILNTQSRKHLIKYT